MSVYQARKLLRVMSPSEAMLWNVLRRRPAGLQFRRQHPVGPYVLDFLCRPAGLAIEVDGKAHDFALTVARDERRDAWLADRGIATLRIPAAEVHRNLEGVVIHIIQRCVGRTPPPAPLVPLPAQSRGGF
jgi:very-short-patch-repair endonuclease